MKPKVARDQLPFGVLGPHGPGGTILARNTLFNLMGQGLPLLAGLVTIPFILRHLGPERFGILSLAFALVAYFQVFDLGLGRASTKFLAEILGRGEEEGLAEIIWTSLAVQTIFGLVGLVLFVALTPLLVDGFLKLSPALVREARVSFYLLAGFMPLVLAAGSLRGTLEAAQRFDLINAVKIPTSTATYLLPLLGIFLGFKLPGIFALLGLSRALVVGLYFWPCRRIFPCLKAAPGLDPKLLKPLFSYGGWVTVANFTGPILAYLERFLIGGLLSVAALALYAAPAEMLSRLTIFPGSLSAALFPAVSANSGKDKARLLAMIHQALKFVLLVMTPLALFLALYAGDILTLWLGAEFARGARVLFVILTVKFFLNSFGHIWLVVVQGLNRPDLSSKLYLVLLPIFAGLCLVLLPALGLEGAALASLVITVLDTAALAFLAGHVAKVRLADFFDRGLRAALRIGAVTAVLGLGLRIIPKPLWVDLIIFTGLILGYAGAAFRWVLAEKEIQGLFGLKDKIFRF